ncbi:hypothetical protein [Tenacibaculum geojense]|uniref:Uncharacterized protein n=1 Tax=Tenacibaculum geojense TaxID=915352 RepID=A0ABW3JW06_9FLAO
MILSKEHYYKRRWFLAILFLLMGFWLLYLSYGLFTYNKNKSELITKNSTPSIIKIEKIRISGSPSVALTIVNDNAKISAIINDDIINKLSEIYNLPDLNKYSFGSELIFNNNRKSYTYCYFKDRLYQLEINDVEVIVYNKSKSFMGFLVLIVALAWISFQIWVLYTLKTKGLKAYG